MKKLDKKKIIIIVVIATCLLIIGVTILCLLLFKNKIVFKLKGNNIIQLTIYNEYQELGFIATNNKDDISENVVIDSSNLDINNLGTYQVTYTLNYKDKTYTLKRTVEVIDDQSPTLTLTGNEQIELVKGSVYQEFGCTAVDNLDTMVNDKIQVINNVNTAYAGIYDVIYKVVDDSGNVSMVTRRVVVKDTANDQINDITTVMSDNEITNMNFIDGGVHVEGYIKDNNGEFKVEICNKENDKCISYLMNKKDDYYFFGDIKLDELDNGDYDVYLRSNSRAKALNKQQMQYRIVRAKVNNKLVTFSYDNNEVSMKIEDFSYQYDIVIDPGHGGIDPGASNQFMAEKTINLMQSQYEKKRYEEHGLKVLLLREDDSYGIMLGDESWPQVRRKAYAVGYYGAVSKITYSNHHNSSEDKSLMGWEIIVPANSDSAFLQNNISRIKEEWSYIYPVNEEHIRLYTRNYNTDKIFSKENEEKYYFYDYYAVLRLPYQLFNIKNVLFEGSYLSNLNDYDWYYNQGNWKKLSEAKIKSYVTSLGLEYIEPQEEVK